MEDLGQDINRVSSFSYYRCTNNSLKELNHYGKISDYVLIGVLKFNEVNVWAQRVL